MAMSRSSRPGGDDEGSSHKERQADQPSTTDASQVGKDIHPTNGNVKSSRWLTRRTLIHTSEGVQDRHKRPAKEDGNGSDDK